MKRRLILTGIILALLTIPRLHAASPTSTGKKIRSLGVKYIDRVRNDDGSYGNRDAWVAGRTALAVYSLSSSQRAYRYTDGPFLSDPIDFLLKVQKPDGSFGEGDSATWQTLAAAKALEVQQDDRFVKPLADAKAYWVKASGKAFPETEGAFFAALCSSIGRTGPLTEKVAELTARVEAKAEGTGAFMKTLIQEIDALQNRTDDTATEYGSFQPTDGPYAPRKGEKLEADPVVATALGVILGDRIKANWKKFAPKE